MSKLLTKRSNTASVVPAALDYGELAVNTADRRLFVGDGTGVVELGTPATYTHQPRPSFPTFADYDAAVTAGGGVLPDLTYYVIVDENNGSVQWSYTWFSGVLTANAASSLNPILFTGLNAATPYIWTGLDPDGKPFTHLIVDTFTAFGDWNSTNVYVDVDGSPGGLQNGEHIISAERAQPATIYLRAGNSNFPSLENVWAGGGLRIGMDTAPPVHILMREGSCTLLNEITESLQKNMTVFGGLDKGNGTYNGYVLTQDEYNWFYGQLPAHSITPGAYPFVISKTSQHVNNGPDYLSLLCLDSVGNFATTLDIQSGNFIAGDTIRMLVLNTAEAVGTLIPLIIKSDIMCYGPQEAFHYCIEVQPEDWDALLAGGLTAGKQYIVYTDPISFYLCLTANTDYIELIYNPSIQGGAWQVITQYFLDYMGGYLPFTKISSAGLGEFVMALPTADVGSSSFDIRLMGYDGNISTAAIIDIPSLFTQPSSFDPNISGLTATTIKTAIDELAAAGGATLGQLRATSSSDSVETAVILQEGRSLVIANDYTIMALDSLELGADAILEVS